MQLLREDANNLQQLSKFLDMVFVNEKDAVLLELASQTLGHLVRSGGAFVADIVNSKVRNIRTCFLV